MLLDEAPEHYVERLALVKARTVQAQLTKPQQAEQVILGSDTTVVCGDQVLAKPDNCQHAVDMLMSLSGRSHQVITAVALLKGEHSLTRVVTTNVAFRTLTEAECRAYWHTGEPHDKAGAYGIQGLGAVFVDHIIGSYTSVVGLPLKETAELLAQMDVPVWQPVAPT